MATPWTTDQDKQLLALFAAKTPKNAIARQLGRPNSSIRSRLLTLGAIDGQPILADDEEDDAPKATVHKAPAKIERTCMRCRVTFLSEGPHNRLCGRCRQVSFSPYAP